MICHDPHLGKRSPQFPHRRRWCQGIENQGHMTKSFHSPCFREPYAEMLVKAQKRSIPIVTESIRDRSPTGSSTVTKKLAF